MEAAGGSGETGRRAGAKEGAARTLAQTFCLVTGIVLIAVGVLGFIFGGQSFSTGNPPAAEPFIVFDVNGWHNIVHLATGAFLVFMAATARTAVTGALIFGVIYVVVTVWGFIAQTDILTIIPINTADNFLHLALAIVALAVAFAAGGLAGAARRQTA
jgi:hypothetical protein